MMVLLIRINNRCSGYSKHHDIGVIYALGLWQLAAFAFCIASPAPEDVFVEDMPF